MSPEPVTAWLVRPRDRANAGAVTLRLDQGVLILSTPDEELRVDATAIRLAQASRELKPIVEEWVRALRDGRGDRP